jgi:protein-disulfide isomerase
MHDSLFASQAKWEAESDPTASFDSLAAAVGVNAASYHACLASPAIAALVAGDQERARSGGVSATPSFWVGGKLIEGAVPPAEMKAAIDQALEGTK